jgi:integrase
MIRFIKTPQCELVFFSRDEFRTLLNAIQEPWLKDVVIFAALTGMRKGEIINLQWKDVDLNRRLVTVQSSAGFTTKRGKRRAVPMNETIVELLRRRQLHTLGEYVFTKGGNRIDKDWNSALFKKYIIKLGLNPKLHFHRLRASFASWLVMDGVPIFAVSKLLGHSDITTTVNHYAHLAPENLHSEVNRLKISLN